MNRLLFWFVAAPLLAQGPLASPGPRPNPAREAGLLKLTPVTTGVREDDHPAIASRGNTAWAAWVSYSETEGSAHIFTRCLENGRWMEPVRVTEEAGDYYKPALTIDAGGTVWVAWSAQAGGNWDIYGRKRDVSGHWSSVERWTTDPAPDIFPSMAFSGDQVLLVWQSPRRNNSDILFRLATSGRWSDEAFVTSHAGNDWEPVAAPASGGGFHVAWDSYRGNYDVFVRTLSNGRWSPELAVASSPRLENHASLSLDGSGRLWIAWEVGPENWASDSAELGLRSRRDVAFACLVNGQLHRAPEAERALAVLAGNNGMQGPAIFAGGDGRLRLFFRQPKNNNWLTVQTTVWNNGAWSAPEKLEYSEGRIDQRIVTTPFNGGVLVAYPAGSSHNIVYARRYEAASPPSTDPLPVLSAAEPPSQRFAQPASTRHTFAGYQLVWGDLHRHTDISEDGGIPDGSLIDAMRYALDAAGLDFLGVTDHTRYLPRRYNLFRIQQISDAFYKRGAFVPVHAYERSQYSPWGHRNIVNLRRDYAPVPASYTDGDPGVSPLGLFEALRGKSALSIPHTTAWADKQVSWDYYDPEIERLVEIYQGLRSTYEYNGAPDPADRVVYEKDSKSFVWDALARGRKLGFIASSDHRSTHMSYAAVYTRDIDRESIFQALSDRRTYAATDKILVDFAIGPAVMGQETTAANAPELKVAVEGTADLARIDIIKDGTFVYTTEPRSRRAAFTFRDEKYSGSESYYYVRVIQSDKNMAWASPIWVRRP